MGDVAFVKEASQLTNEMVNKYAFHGSPSDYKRLGDNNMFGDKVLDSSNNNKNVLDYNYYRIENSETFMMEQGYYQAEKVKVRETWTRSKGGAFGGDNFASDNYSISLQESEGLTYAKPKDLNKKTVHKHDTTYPPFITYNEFVYSFLKIEEQDYRATARWSNNRVGKIFDMAEFLEVVKHLNEAGLNNAEAGRAAKEQLQKSQIFTKIQTTKPQSGNNKNAFNKKYDRGGNNRAIKLNKLPRFKLK